MWFLRTRRENEPEDERFSRHLTHLKESGILLGG